MPAPDDGSKPAMVRQTAGPFLFVSRAVSCFMGVLCSSDLHGRVDCLRPGFAIAENRIKKSPIGLPKYANSVTQVTYFRSHLGPICGKKRLLLFVLAPLAFVQ